MKRLIINADDLGITSQRSHGIFLCFEQGVVSSATILPNFPHSETAARHAKEREIPAGLHLNFTQGYPLSKQTDIESLLTHDGLFLGRESFERALAEGTIEKTHVEREARAQFEWMLDSYGQPTHLDSHHNVHIHPEITPILLPILDRYSISFVRIPIEPLPPYGFELEEERLSELRNIVSRAETAKALFAAHDIRTTDHFRGLALAGKASMRNLKHTLARLEDGTTELMVHPGSPNPSGDEFETHPQRLTELQMLTNPEVPGILKEREITLCSYRELL